MEFWLSIFLLSQHKKGNVWGETDCFDKKKQNKKTSFSNHYLFFLGFFFFMKMEKT